MKVLKSSLSATAIILLTVLMAACTMSEKRNDETEISTRQTKAKTLLHEADSLLRADSLFWARTVTSRQPHTAIHDRLILQKLDSAILLSPDCPQGYLQKYMYLIACRQSTPLLPLLQQMDQRCNSLQGDLLSLKGLLEFHQGDSLHAMESFQRADQAFQRQISQCSPSDSLLYGSLRLSKALNLSLMKNNFTPFQKELKLFQEIHPQTGTQSLNEILPFKSREDYYRQLFPEN